MFSKYVKISGKDVGKMVRRGVNERDLLKFGTERYNPKQAVKDAVEQLYFEDLDKKELKDYVRSLSLKSSVKGTPGGIDSLTIRVSTK